MVLKLRLRVKGGLEGMGEYRQTFAVVVLFRTSLRARLACTCLVEQSDKSTPGHVGSMKIKIYKYIRDLDPIFNFVEWIVG